MRRFDLHRPTTVADACRLLADEPGALPMSGGTALVLLMKQRFVQPRAVVDLKRIPGLGAITEAPDGTLEVGGLARISAVERSALVRERFPLLAQACHAVASVRIRNGATLGGNLALADYQSDPMTALIALGARVHLVSHNGGRTVVLDEFVTGPYSTLLDRGEIVTAVSVPPPAAGVRGAYFKFSSHAVKGRQTAALAALVGMQEGIVTSLRLVVGAAAGRPAVIPTDDAVGRRLDASLVERVAAAATDTVDAITDLRGDAYYKRHVAGVLTRRALLALAEGA